jgi:hypothetical protein
MRKISAKLTIVLGIVTVISVVVLLARATAVAPWINAVNKMSVPRIRRITINDATLLDACQDEMNIFNLLSTASSDAVSAQYYKCKATIYPWTPISDATWILSGTVLSSAIGLPTESGNVEKELRMSNPREWLRLVAESDYTSTDVTLMSRRSRDIAVLCMRQRYYMRGANGYEPYWYCDNDYGALIYPPWVDEAHGFQTKIIVLRFSNNTSAMINIYLCDESTWRSRLDRLISDLSP